MFINEIFYSIQGEGLLAGVPSVFIRLAGCPLHCTWCDTKYAWDPNAGDDLTIPQIIERIENLKLPPPTHQKINKINSAVSAVKSRFVVLTGGEPMANPQLAQLAKALNEQGKHITIETAGVAYIPRLACDLLSISPKTSNSGTKSPPACPEQSRRDAFFTIKQLIEHYPYQLKFVVDSPNDLFEIQQIVKSLGDFDLTRVMLMPQAKTRDDLIAKSPMVAELCKNTGYVFCNRLQIFLYNARRGK